nr:MAG TPA: hypothetical protein [Caudoviricetes sp.]
MQKLYTIYCIFYIFAVIKNSLWRQRIRSFQE